MGDWTKIPLEKAADITMGQSPDSKFYNNEGKGIKFLQGCAEFGDRFPAATNYCTQPNRIAKKNAILFSVRAPVGRINLADQDYCIGRGLAALIPKDIDEDFFYWQIDYLTTYQLRNTQGSTFDSINSGELRKLEILKPLEPKEQKAIATIISKVDKAIEDTEKIIEKYKRIKTGLMQELLTKGIDEKGNIRSERTHRFKDSVLGRIPEEWEAIELGKIFKDFQTGATPRRNNPLYWNRGKILWVTSGELKYKKIYDTIEKITEIAVVNTNLKIYPPETFFIAITGLEAEGTRGSCAIIANEATTNQSCMAFESNDKIDVRYLYQYYLYWGKYISIKYAQGTKQQSLNGNIVAQIPILLSKNKMEQLRIAEKLESFDNFIEQQNNSLEKLNSLKRGLMQNLLTGKVPMPEELIKEINKN